jgi:hypothetical protein
MVRRHPEPDQAERCRQPLEQVHLDPADARQLIGRIARARARPHDRHPQRSRRHRGVIAFNWRDVGVQRVPLEVGGVDVAEPRQVGRQVLLVIDRIDGARLKTQTALNAHHRIDVQHLRIGELARFADRTDAVHRTHRYTTGVLTATLRNHIHHPSPLASAVDCRFT